MQSRYARVFDAWMPYAGSIARRVASASIGVVVWD
jgi:hypothetical protein